MFKKLLLISFIGAGRLQSAEEDINFFNYSFSLEEIDEVLTGGAVPDVSSNSAQNSFLELGDLSSLLLKGRWNIPVGEPNVANDSDLLTQETDSRYASALASASLLRPQNKQKERKTHRKRQPKIPFIGITAEEIKEEKKARNRGAAQKVRDRQQAYKMMLEAQLKTEEIKRATLSEEVRKLELEQAALKDEQDLIFNDLFLRLPAELRDDARRAYLCKLRIP